MSVFVDTNVLAAGWIRNDGLHRRATSLLRGVATQDPFTTNDVLVESFGLLSSRASHSQARALWFGLYETPIRLEMVTAQDLARARSIAELWTDQMFSMVDCTSFAVMERLGCSRAVSFDADFAIYRYGVGRKNAFEIVR